mmetsp:Transcript_14634/g.31823  ORF Transcript_14634/g.31823 Transcript_14634/m.31823 type:complete len:119 (-) Transcript_14634:99-455(-)|eukprot:CAMPEP_0172313414 /NCGR_PEP_ID=MMETSP1058-20130122/20158_1 /TAXON_ID=83371 /ORGANISM="Detonula confervacea, Strain CCMP 353" /LENGTH=118 /DNA_ID=CAMNT_0013027059 /DNA_START=586 /DNA_END=942 /DNA_ORIENTATION=+
MSALRLVTGIGIGSIGAGDVCFRDGPPPWFRLDDGPDDARRSLFRDNCEWDSSDGLLLSANATIIWPAEEWRPLFRITFEWDPSDDLLLSANATIIILLLYSNTTGHAETKNVENAHK